MKPWPRRERREEPGQVVEKTDFGMGVEERRSLPSYVSPPDPVEAFPSDQIRDLKAKLGIRWASLLNALAEEYERLAGATGPMPAGFVEPARFVQSLIESALKSLADGRAEAAVGVAFIAGQHSGFLNARMEWEEKVRKARNSTDATRAPRPGRENAAVAWVKRTRKDWRKESPKALFEAWERHRTVAGIERVEQRTFEEKLRLARRKDSQR